MLKDPKDTTELSLLYANVSPDDILLREELDALAAKHDNFSVWYTGALCCDSSISWQLVGWARRQGLDAVRAGLLDGRQGDLGCWDVQGTVRENRCALPLHKRTVACGAASLCSRPLLAMLPHPCLGLWCS